MATATLKDMLSTVLQQAEGEIIKEAAAAPDGAPANPGSKDQATDPAQAQAGQAGQAGQEAQAGEETKIASVDAIAFADDLDALGDSFLGTTTEGSEKTAAAPGDLKAQLLAKLGAKSEVNLVPNNRTDQRLPASPQKPDKATQQPPMKPGTQDRTAMENTLKPSPPTLAQSYPDSLLKASAEQREQAKKVAAVRERLMQKLGEDAINPATLSSPRMKGNPEDEQPKAQPMQSDRGLIGSNMAAIDFTKGQAKASPKKALGQVLNEPALSRSTDSKLHENLANTAKAGVKISAADREGLRAHLRKVATAVGTPEHDWLVEQVRGVRMQKEAGAKNQTSIREALAKRVFAGSPGSN